MKYALLTAAKYKALNEAISKAMGFPDERSDTYIYAPEEPIMDASGNCVMEIGADVQKTCTELLADIKLVDSYEPIPYN